MTQQALAAFLDSKQVDLDSRAWRFLAGPTWVYDPSMAISSSSCQDHKRLSLNKFPYFLVLRYVGLTFLFSIYVLTNIRVCKPHHPR